MSKQIYNVKAKIERDGIEPFWMHIGTANLLSDGRIIMSLDALPLHSKGVMMLFPVDKRGDKNE